MKNARRRRKKKKEKKWEKRKIKVEHIQRNLPSVAFCRCTQMCAWEQGVINYRHFIPVSLGKARGIKQCKTRVSWAMKQVLSAWIGIFSTLRLPFCFMSLHSFFFLPSAILSSIHNGSTLVFSNFYMPCDESLKVGVKRKEMHLPFSWLEGNPTTLWVDTKNETVWTLLFAFESFLSQTKLKQHSKGH